MRIGPPVKSLQVFELAARECNFSTAARQLCITQSAVSHHIRVLEQYYAEPLFFRSGRHLQLTLKGEEVLRRASPIFEGLAQMSVNEELTESQTVRLAVYSSFAIRWLMPRLPAFRAQHPQINLVLNSFVEDPGLSDTVADIFITVRSDAEGFYFYEIKPERLIPVCNPTLLQGNTQITMQDLPKYPLLVVDSPVYGNDWQIWADFNQFEFHPNQKRYHFNHTLLAVESAVAGHGIALGFEIAVINDIKQGRLCRLDLPFCQSGFTYYLACKKSRVRQKAIQATMSWLKSCIRDSEPLIESSTY